MVKQGGFIYIDNNATTRVSPGVAEEMEPLLKEAFGNPSSTHLQGRHARKLLDTARLRVAALLHCEPGNIIFTSGGTESNNLAILGFAHTLTGKKHFITSNVEHPSVLQVFRFLEYNGHRVTYLPVDEGGLLTPGQLEEAIAGDTALISLMMANNETGVIFPIREMGIIARGHGIPFHCDAVQGAGKLAIDVNDLGVDLLTVSAHKINGPKGAGALFVRQPEVIVPLVFGGGQEGGKRSGTEPLPAIVGMGKACLEAHQAPTEDIPRVTELRDRLERGILEQIPGARINGANPRLGNTCNVLIPGTRSSDMVDLLSRAGVNISHGSACSVCHGKASHVLEAMGLGPEDVNASLRFSLSKENRVEEIEKVLEILPAIAEHLRDSDAVACPVCRLTGGTAENDMIPSNATPANADVIRGLKTLWTETMGEEDICIAILDGPVDLSHACFKGAALTQVTLPGSPSPGTGETLRHGTHVASIVFGQTGSPVQGVAPGCKGIVVPVFNEGDDGRVLPCTQETLAQGIMLAVQQGAHVINISGGMLTPSEKAEGKLADAICYCEEKGILVVAAAGNDGCQCSHIPAAVSTVLSVGSEDRQGLPMAFSNWGDAYREHGILAPGEFIHGAVPGGGTTIMSGTSYAAPIVSGVAGLLLSAGAVQNRPPDHRAVRQALLNTASRCNPRQYNYCERFLVGRLDASKAYQHLLEAEKSVNSSLEAAAFQTTDEPISILKIDNKEVSKMADHEKDQEMMDITPDNQGREETAGEQESQPVAAIEASALNAEPSGASPHEEPPDCSFNFNGNHIPPKVYVLGLVGFDFLSESRREAFAQYIGNPYNPAQMLDYLDENPYDADEIVWTLNIDETPVYAIRPGGNYAEMAYQRLREFLRSQSDEEVERVSIPGVTVGSVTISTGQQLTVINPILRGMYSWTTDALVTSVAGEEPDDKKAKDKHQKKKDDIYNFLERIYYETRNLGTLPQERAMNYAATRAFQFEKIFEEAMGDSLELSSINVEKSPVSRPGSDNWDVKLVFFHPKKRMEIARKVYRLTVDVSDVVPITVGKVRSWSFY